MRSHVKIATAIAFFGVLSMSLWALYSSLTSQRKDIQASDASDLKGSLRIAVDGWIGYFPLCSPHFKKSMRRAGYRIDCIDDGANYTERYRKLAKNRYDFAVGTVDAYLLNAKADNYPGQIVAVIDQSKGGDALVVKKQAAKTIDDLKTSAQLKIAYTPDSPSEHLLRFLAVHFGIDRLIDSSTWSVPSQGSEDALRRLQSGEVNAAVVWQPDVAKALEDKSNTKLFDTGQVTGLIVDILVASNNIVEQPELVKRVLINYFQTLQYYAINNAEFISHVAAQYEVSTDTAKTITAGVDWINLSDNRTVWMPNDTGSDTIIQSINSTVSVLLNSHKLNENPLPNRDPYTLLSSAFVKQIYQAWQLPTAQHNQAARQQKSPLSADEWLRLVKVGTFKTEPIRFSTASSQLNVDDELRIREMQQKLAHYPNYFIEVQGHTSVRGDEAANLKLSQLRAQAVVTKLIHYGISANQIRAQGYGGAHPLDRLPGESRRAYHYRLPRVEIILKTMKL